MKHKYHYGRISWTDLLTIKFIKDVT
jgi:hypothetical protein